MTTDAHMSPVASEQHPKCPDDGTCHHRCGETTCFRVVNASPLSDVFPGDTWPPIIEAAYPDQEYVW